MATKDEDVEITVKERPNENLEGNNIFEYELNTGEAGVLTITMPELINKYIEAIVLLPEQTQVDINLSFRESGLIIYEKLAINEARYIPLRHTSFDKRDEMFNFAPQNIFLFALPELSIRGGKNASIKIKIITC